MSGPQKSKKKPTGDYSVGYCKPPASAKWKPGKSANPSGRPKKLPSPYELFEEQAYKLVNGKVGGKPVQLPMLSFGAIATLRKAADGNVRAFEAAFKVAASAHAEAIRAAAAIATEEKAFSKPREFSWDKEKEELFQELAAVVAEVSKDGVDGISTAPVSSSGEDA